MYKLHLFTTSRSYCYPVFGVINHNICHCPFVLLPYFTKVTNIFGVELFSGVTNTTQQILHVG